VKVLNYCVYQGSETETEQQLNNQRTTSEQQVNTDNNGNNVKNDKNYLVDFFESLWKLYPKKEGKGNVSKTQKEKLFKIGTEEMDRVIKRYVQAKNGEDKKYLQMGSTFFNSGYVDYLDKNYHVDKPKGRVGVSQAEDPGPRRDDM